MIKKILFVFFISAGLFAQTTYYVSNSGNDSNSGKSQSDPWKTISKVNNFNFDSGDMILFKGGDKFEDSPLIINIVGITVASYGNEKAIIGDKAAKYDGATIQIEANEVKIDNLIVLGDANTSNKGADAINYFSDGVTVSNNIIEGGEYSHGGNGSHQRGISGIGKDITIVGNRVSDFITGINCVNPIRVIVENNIVYNVYNNTGGGGVGIKFASDLFPNTFASNYTSFIRNNTIHHWQYKAFLVSSVSEIIVEYNEFYSPYPASEYPKGYAGGGGGTKASDRPESATDLGTFGTIIRYNIFRDFRGAWDGIQGNDAISLSQGHDGLIYGNLIYNIDGRSVVNEGSDLKTHSDARLEVYNNLLWGGKSNAVYIGPKVNRPTYIQNNIIYMENNVVPAFLLKDDSFTGNNIFTNRKGIFKDQNYNGTTAIFYQYGTHTSIGQENVYNAGISIFRNFTENDFQVTENSPAKDNAYKLSNYFRNNNINVLSNDILGVKRDANPDIGCFEFTNTVTPPPSGYVNAGVKVYLEGNYNSGSMNKTLNDAILLPGTQPYSGEPWNYSGTEKVSNLPSGFVDWVLIELRNEDFTVAARRAALLMQDGTVTDLDGSNDVKFEGVASGNYYITVLHRNHLGVMSAEPVALSQNNVVYDFTGSRDNAYGENPLKDLGDGTFGLFAGDGNSDGIINVLDYGEIANNKSKSGYLGGDVNMDSVVNDSDFENTNSNLFNASSVPASDENNSSEVK